MDNTMDRETLENIIKENKLVLLYFGSDSCSVCVDMKPKIDNIVRKYDKIEHIKIDIEKNLKLAREYNIFTMPAVLLYIEGKEVIREARYLSIYELENKISRYYSLLFDE